MFIVDSVILFKDEIVQSKNVKFYLAGTTSFKLEKFKWKEKFTFD